MASAKRDRQRARKAMHTEPGVPGTMIQDKFPPITRLEGDDASRGDWYRMGKLTICVSLDPADETSPTGLFVPQMACHMSVSHPERYPTWDEVKYLRYKLLPDVPNMAFFLPSEETYLDCHPYCFQLWETHAKGQIDNHGTSRVATAMPPTLLKNGDTLVRSGTVDLDSGEPV